MAYACKICIATKGLKGSEIRSLPQTEDELYDHIERVHGICVQRKGETKEQAEQRFRTAEKGAAEPKGDSDGS